MGKKPTIIAPSKIRLTETQAVFDKLKSELSHSLAPRLIGLMEDFGYDSFTAQNGTHSRDVVTIKELKEISMADSGYWKRQFGLSARPEIVHTGLLNMFRKLRQATEHLIKIRSEVERSLEWIDKIGTVGKRTVLFEKALGKQSKK